MSVESMPSISIVTPSYNQGKYLRSTIKSVLEQGYKNCEYIIMDGGSNDGSKDIIKSYSSKLAYWRSEKDGGQSASIKEGFSLSSGEILGWVNSDDLLIPGCLTRVGKYFADHPETDCVAGGTIVIDENSRVVRNFIGMPRIVRGERETLDKLLARRGCSFYQPASFWRRKAYEEAGGLDPKYQFAMDYDLYLKLASKRPFGHIDAILACFRIHSNSKTATIQSVCRMECAALWKQYGSGKNIFISELWRAVLFAKNLVRNASIRIKNRNIKDINDVSMLNNNTLENTARR